MVERVREREWSEQPQMETRKGEYNVRIETGARTLSSGACSVPM